jgi:type II secretory pathway predicted ATPase ExeA
MYQEYFRLHRYPFGHTTDPILFFEGGQQREALARLTYGLQEGRDMMLLSGKVGSGKSVLAGVFTARLGPQWQIIKTDNPWISVRELFRFVRRKLAAISEQGAPEGYREPLEVISRILVRLQMKGVRTLLVIDDAEQCSEETLVGVRLLSALETGARRLLPILLVATEELETRLDTPALRPLMQRITMSYSMGYLSGDETDAYILQHLRAAGADHSLFPRDCVDLIYQFSQGCPRLINQACDDVLLRAYSERQPHISPTIVRNALSKSPRQISPAAARESVPTIHKPAQAAPPPSVTPAATPLQSSPLPFEPPVPGRPASPRKTVFSLSIFAAFCLGASIVLLWSVVQGSYPHSQPSSRGRTTGHVQPATAAAALGPPQAPLSRSAPVVRPVPMPPANSIRRAHIDPRTPLIYWVTELFGAWNATVRDLLATFNPGLDPIWPPSGEDLSIPVLNRADLIVTNEQGQVFVYVASFEDPTEAHSNLGSLQRVVTSALLLPIQRGDRMVWRLYGGPFLTKSAALSALEAIPFTHLPVLERNSVGQSC